MPVLARECIEALNIRPDGVYVDATTGGGGHSALIAARLGPGGRLFCIDRDSDALAAAGERLQPFADRITFIKSNFEDLRSVLEQRGVTRIDGILFDLGVSSYQLDNPARGFSYMTLENATSALQSRGLYIRVSGGAAAGGEGEQRPRDQHAGDEQPAHRQRQQHVAAQQQAAGGAALRALFAQGAEHPAVEDQVERKENAERQPGQLMK